MPEEEEHAVRVARLAFEADAPQYHTPVKRSTLRAKPRRVPRTLTIRLSGFVWSLIGAALVGGFGNMVLIVVAALTFGSK